MEYGRTGKTSEARKSDHGLPDSGTRQAYSTGALKEEQTAFTGKGRFDLIPWGLLWSYIKRLAIHYERGAIKYNPRNWEKGIPVSRYFDSFMHHLDSLTRGETDEDHGAALMWNAVAMVWTVSMVNSGKLPKELDDREVVFRKF